MPSRAAIVTGASRGIGFAVAETLGEEGFGLTLTARKPEGSSVPWRALGDRGFEVEHVAANLADEEGIARVVERHRERFGRLDVLVNNAGVGIGAAAGASEQAHRSPARRQHASDRALLSRLPRDAARRRRGASQRAGGQHGSLAGKSPQPWLSVYSATKAAVIAYTRAMNKELAGDGIKSVAFCPGFVDTDMSEFVKEQIPAEEMLRTTDITEALRFLLRVSPSCVVPELVFERPGEAI